MTPGHGRRRLLTGSTPGGIGRRLVRRLVNDRRADRECHREQNGRRGGAPPFIRTGRDIAIDVYRMMFLHADLQGVWRLDA